MSEKLISVIGSGADFKTRAIASGTISAGLNGDVLTLTPPAGQRVRITHLTSRTGSNTFVNLTFGSTLLGAFTLTDGSSSSVIGEISIGGTPDMGNHVSITGEVDEAFIVAKGGPATTLMDYGYEFGE